MDCNSIICTLTLLLLAGSISNSSGSSNHHDMLHPHYDQQPETYSNGTIAAQVQLSHDDPFYADPLFDAAHDAEFVWHEKEQAWWMIYLQNR